MKTSLFIPAFACLLLFGCAPKNEFQPPPPPGVTIQKPEQKTVTVYQSFPGRLVAHDDVEIRARVKGFLKSIDFEDGAVVKKGDLLFTIEPEQYEAAVNSAKANVAQAQAALKLADATLKRNEKAYETKAVSEVDVLTAEAQKESAEAEVQAAVAALDNANLDLSYTKIHAPMDGRLSRRLLSVGNLVGDGQATLLTSLVVEAPIDVFFNVDERALIPFISISHGGKTGRNLPPVNLELADGSLIKEEGVIDYKDPEIDPETGTLRVRALFQNTNHSLVPGLYGKILLPKKIEDALLVPDLCVQQDMAGSYILVVNGENIVESIYVTEGPLVGMQRVIEVDPARDRQVTVEDQVIVNGLQRARPGIPVTITQVDSATAAPAAN